MSDASASHQSTQRAGDRDQVLAEREGGDAHREEALRSGEGTAQVGTGREMLLDQLREANEHLLLATLRAQTLAEKAAHLAAIVESTDDAVFSTTLEPRIKTWNAGAERLYGYTAEEAIGLSGTVLIPPERADEFTSVLERITQGEAIGRFETVRVRADGTRIDVAQTISSIKDDEGRIVGASVIGHDITDAKRTEREREALLRCARDARVEADTANHLKDDFLAMVSHELRTPLNAVLGWARMITSQQLQGPRVERALEAIERNAAALAVIIDDLLDMSRIVAGKLDFVPGSVDLVAVTLAAIEGIRPLASQKRIDLQIPSDPNAAESVHGDAARLQQVIGNLLTNAIKFTPEGGRVEVSLARVDADMEVKVTDTGDGIEPAFLPHVFEQFRQADASAARRQGGLGLGLALVRQLVELHGGTVHAASEGRGRGATFTVRLPTGQTAAGREPAKGPAIPATSTAHVASQRLDGVSVLVVDDNLDGRTLAEVLLTHHGARVNAVASAHEALRALQTDAPDVLVTDIGLPDEDGYVLLSQVRLQHDRFIPAIALTGYGGAEDRCRVRANGFQAHIIKPFEPTELISAIGSLARARQSS